MRVYLDNCCFNRPFDDQTMVRIRLESEAKIHVQRMIRAGEIELAWSHILDYESDANPFEERRAAVERWKARAATDVEETPEVLDKAMELEELGVKSKDALHVACAIYAQCEYFPTTDDALLGKGKAIPEIKIIDPPAFIREVNR